MSFLPCRSLSVNCPLVQHEQGHVGREHLGKPGIIDLTAAEVDGMLDGAGTPKQVARQKVNGAHNKLLRYGRVMTGIMRLPAAP